MSTGIITTFAGTGSGGHSGDNGPATSATLDYLRGVALDSTGSLQCNSYSSLFLLLSLYR